MGEYLNKKNVILITGGGLFNKGAEAMTYICISEMSRRFPNHEIYVAVNDSWPQEQYKIKIIDQKWIEFSGQYDLNLLEKMDVLYNHRNKYAYKRGIDLWKRITIVLDVGGYAIGKKWGYAASIIHARRGYIADHFGAKSFYMPQSFGSLDFENTNIKRTLRIFNKYLQKADVIYAREQEGYELLTGELALRNVRLSNDMVLLNKSVDYSTIFNIKPDCPQIEINDNTVVVIPSKHIANTKEDKGFKIYKNIVDHFLSIGTDVLFMRHCIDDDKICAELYGEYKGNKRVRYLNEDVSSYNMEDILKRFRYAVISRYHALVHSYKVFLPCFVIGWAEKYNSVMSLFEQERFYIDLSDMCDEEDYIRLLDRYIESRDELQRMIKKGLPEIQSTDIFDEIEKIIRKEKRED